ncbi:hypothetical protein CAI21_10905 [Alkalilimnicola ehrlichii]|uniref:Methyl-accepting chemotaxis protein n=1 Tax=Alkalilimnicola ehrlichii TaxID=351052 RepID=A0A3E0WT59_9GAMM|nr:methyl-accepting chemotaxis protein [Alkalilimnicola ehrlichii]RFA29259.1 hypothetical protein CAI21_10905 [Alkalilimnicola ehrlichii]RFA36172.1 hypothetical protein CAL65_12060 [Alkalilimnicola ehrlichii]
MVGLLKHLLAQIKVSHRLYALSGVLLALLVATGSFGLYGLASANEKLRSTYEDRAVPLAALGRGLDDINKARMRLLTAMQTRLTRHAHEHFDAMAAYDESGLAHFETLLQRAQTPEEIALREEFQERWERYDEARNQAVQTYLDGSSGGALTTIRIAVNPAFDELVETVNALMDYQEALSRQEFDNSIAAYQLLRASMIGLVAVGFLLAIGLAVSTIRSISKPLQLAMQVAHSIAHGRLNSQIPQDRRDEFGSLLDSLRKMQERLQGMIAEIAQGAEQLSSSATELSETYDQITTGSAQQSDAASSIAATVDSVSENFAGITTSTESAQAKAEEAVAMSLTGQDSVAKASSEIKKIAQAVGDSSRSVQSLEQYSTQINGIATTIKQIAEQTNLLALNAAIEAARAGDQGRGFAVVADEVRELASRTGEATTNIHTVLETIQDEIAKASAAMELGNQRVESGVRAVDDLVPSLAALNEGATVTKDDLVTLTALSQEQLSKTRQIAEEVERIAKMADGNNQKVARTSDAVHELERLAASLKISVSRFN